MCGIACIVNYNSKEKMPLEMIGRLFKKMEERGTDASGIYFERPSKGGKMIRKLFKMPEKASVLWGLIQDPKDDISEAEKAMVSEYRLDGTERLIFLHTRNGTQGSEKDNNNNMPIFSKDYVLIHNGVVDADRLDGYPYKGEVDSEEILARIQNQSLKDGITGVSGGMAIMTKKFSEDCFYIYRHSNPIDLAYWGHRGLLIGCSRAEYLGPDTITSDFQDYLFKIGQAAVMELPAHTAYEVSLTKRSIKEIFSAEPSPRKAPKTIVCQALTRSIADAYANAERMSVNGD